MGFFQAVTVSLLLYGYTTWMLAKRVEKNKNATCCFEKTWKPDPTQQQLYSHKRSFPSLFLYHHPYSSPPLLNILEPHQNKFILPVLTAPDPDFSFFFPLDRILVPLRAGPACFRRFRTPENSRAPYRREGNQTGNFFFFRFFFFSHPQHNIL